MQVGLFIAGLWLDSVQGAADDSLRVKFRATQVRWSRPQWLVS